MSLGVRILRYPVTRFRMLWHPMTYGSIGNRSPTSRMVPHACRVVFITLHALSQCEISHTWLCEWCKLCDLCECCKHTWRCVHVYICSLVIFIHLWWLRWIENDVRTSWCLNWLWEFLHVLWCWIVDCALSVNWNLIILYLCLYILFVEHYLTSIFRVSGYAIPLGWCRCARLRMLVTAWVPRTSLMLSSFSCCFWNLV